jgi:hypothetical protein
MLHLIVHLHRERFKGYVINRCYKVSLGNYEITYPLWDLAELMLDEQATYKEVNNSKS